MVDLNQLSAHETAFVYEFLDHMRVRGRVCSEDFPEMDPDRFDELAEAILTVMNKPELH